MKISKCKISNNKDNDKAQRNNLFILIDGIAFKFFE